MDSDGIWYTRPTNVWKTNTRTSAITTNSGISMYQGWPFFSTPRAGAPSLRDPGSAASCPGVSVLLTRMSVVDPAPPTAAEPDPLYTVSASP